jgi:hypothetical protein
MWAWWPRLFHPGAARLLRYTECALPPEQMERVRRHLASCDACRDEIRLNGEALRWLAERQPAHRDQAFDSIRERLLEEVQAPAPPQDVARLTRLCLGPRSFGELARRLRRLRRANLPLADVATPLFAAFLGRGRLEQSGPGGRDNAPAESASGRLGAPRTLSQWLILATVVHVVAGLVLWAAWRAGAQFEPLQVYFDGPGVLFLTCFAALELMLAAFAWSSFTWSQPMWACWGCLTVAAAVRLAGVVIAHVLTASTWLNPLPAWAGRKPLHEIGIMLTGPGHVLLVILAMAIALQVYWAEGWRARLRWIDYAALGAVGVYVARQIYELAFVYRGDLLREPWKLLNWVTDPALLTGLGLGLLLYRTSGGFVHGGLVGRCWAYYAIGMGLSAVGDMGSWAVYSSRLTWEQASLVTWYIWYPAAAAYAVAPALQVEAVMEARRMWNRAFSAAR